ncbi:unnamed protein product [Paramecium pentaurelia]|uniref:Uncharacterized protein n=1 Tax=Paramecium pentaurelia TaxID=43138 RepID=A0A8S1X6G5_9CILI|nr:unnamed protein product [Paramecium pentaurelia]
MVQSIQLRIFIHFKIFCLQILHPIYFICFINLKILRSLNNKMKNFKNSFKNLEFYYINFDYHSQSQPLNIAKIIGHLYDLMIKNSIKLNDLTHYFNTANNFIQNNMKFNHIK